jgi:flagellar biosynthesis/type III secretory pathway chaperone
MCKVCGRAESDLDAPCHVSNKDAALELAKNCDTDNRTLNALEQVLAKVAADARKPLEDDIEGLLKDTQSLANDLHRTEQQLLATQEAYQRVAGAANLPQQSLSEMVHRTWAIEEALANPPSMDMVERKKLEDEIAVLEKAAATCRPYDEHFRHMMTERKAKLGKM